MLTADQLLTVPDVANILQIAPRTVYDNKYRLGGFYPAGLRVLRFPPGVILGYLEGQGTENMGLRVPISQEVIRVRGTRNTPGGRSRKVKTAGGCKGPGHREYQSDQNRHGLFGGV